MGGTLGVACLVLSSLAACSNAADVTRSRDSGGSAGTAGTAQLPTDSSGNGGASGARPSDDAGGQSGGNAGEPSSAGQVGVVGGGGSSEVSATPTVSEIFDTYKTWQPQTPEPVAISAYIFGLCRLPTLPEQAFAESVHGDERYLQDWANEEARAGIARRGDPPFASGSVIVKEKHVMTGSGLELVAVAMMIKREQGFEAAHGDWDYVYYEPELGVIQTKEQSEYCSGCHASASSTDFIFVDGLQGD
jgi:Cytochrome P460